MKSSQSAFFQFRRDCKGLSIDGSAEGLMENHMGRWSEPVGAVLHSPSVCFHVQVRRRKDEVQDRHPRASAVDVGRDVRFVEQELFVPLHDLYQI